MSVLAKRISDSALFKFTCAQWALMSDASKADWEAQENTCAVRRNEGSPYAASDQFSTIQGTVGAAAPITITLIDGVYTIGLAYGAGLDVVDGVLINSAPDQEVILNEGANITITGTYPEFTIEASGGGGGGGVTDGDKGDITVSSSGAVWTIDNGAVTDAKLRDGIGFSVIGRSANTTGAVADIQATADGQVLRLSGAALGFGQVATAGIENSAVTYEKMQDTDALSVLGRSAITSGAIAPIGAGTDGHVLRRSGTTLGFGQVASGGIADAAITFAKIQNLAALSVFGRSANTAGVGGNITATTDGQVLRLAGATLGFGQVATAGITDQAVTYAKIQNMNTNRVLGRTAAGAGVVQELDAAAIYTLLGFTGQANRFAVWTGANTLTHNAAFTFTLAPDRVTFNGSAAGTGANNAILNVNSGAIAGATEFIRMSGNINGNMAAVMVNSHNASVNSNTLFQISSGGANAGDAVMQFTVSGQMTHAIGIDNSDGDRFKLTPDSAAPGGNANMGLILRNNGGLGNTGVNIDFPTFPLTVKGRTRGEQFIGEGNLWAAGNVAFGAGAGTGPTLTTIIGTNNSVEILFTTGTAPTANGNIFTLTYPLAFPTRSQVTFSAGGENSGAAGDNAANDFLKFKINRQVAGDCILKAVGTLSASTSYMLTFQIFGY